MFVSVSMSSLQQLFVVCAVTVQIVTEIVSSLCRFCVTHVARKDREENQLRLLGFSFLRSLQQSLTPPHPCQAMTVPA